MSGPVEPPVVAGCVYGLRVWNLSAGSGDFWLSSATARHQWNYAQPRPAKCRKNPHPVPAPDCTCGYYCFHLSPDSMLRVQMATTRPSTAMSIAGIVKVWGRIEAHATGMRSEFATPEVLFMPKHPSAAFRDMVTELAEKYGAEIWSGTSNELLEHARKSKPGLPAELTRFNDQHPRPEPMPRRYGLAAIGGALVSRSTEVGLPGESKPIRPDGFWLENSLPSAEITELKTTHGHRIVKLEGVVEAYRERGDRPPVDPGTRLILDLTGNFGRGKGSIAVTTGDGSSLIGFLPQATVRGLMTPGHSIPPTGVWVLCNWLQVSRSPQTRLRAVHVLIAESKADVKLTFPPRPLYRRRKRSPTARKLKQDGAGGDGPAGPHEGPGG